MNIDWSTAPEDATHYSQLAALGMRWRRETKFGWDTWKGKEWISTVNAQPHLYIERESQSSPVWTGEGLPPVGTVCEFAGGTPCPEDPFDKDLRVGMKVTIIAHFKCGDFTMAAFTFDPENPDRGMVQVEQGNFGCFRPIRTPEQIAAEEREDAIQLMLSELKNTQCLTSHYEVCESLYQAGYRKQAAP